MRFAEENTEAKIRGAVRLVLALIVARDYVALSRLTTEGDAHLKPEDIRRSIESYPGTPRMPLNSELAFDAIAVQESAPPRYIVDAPVFTEEEGRSDLIARMTVVDKPGEDFDVILYDAWVM